LSCWSPSFSFPFTPFKKGAYRGDKGGFYPILLSPPACPPKLWRRRMGEIRERGRSF
jgi:hypothetical protein